MAIAPISDGGKTVVSFQTLGTLLIISPPGLFRRLVGFAAHGRVAQFLVLHS